MNHSEEIYNRNIKINKEKSDSLKVKINTVSIIRLGIVILCLLTDYFCLLYTSPSPRDA